MIRIAGIQLMLLLAACSDEKPPRQAVDERIESLIGPDRIHGGSFLVCGHS